MRRVVLIMFVIQLATLPNAMALTLNGITIKSLNIEKPLGELVFMSTSVSPTPHGCHTDVNWNFTLPLNTSLDRQIYASLLAAMLSGKKVDIEGTSTCSSFATIESVKRVRVHSQ